MKRIALLSTVLSLAMAGRAQTLHYNQPAQYFEEALPIGNGKLGAMVYGGNVQDRLSLNDITLWTGEPDLAPVNPEAYRHLPEVREALDREDYEAADTLVRRLQGHQSEKYQPLGTLLIDYLDEARVSEYNRALDLSTAVVTVSCKRDGAPFRTEYFASSPDSVIVVRIETEGKGGIRARLRLEGQLPHSTRAGGHRITSQGYAAWAANSYYINGRHGEQFFYDPERGIHYSTIVEVIADGDIVAEDSTLLLDGCSAATILITNQTSFNGADKDPARDGRDYRAEAESIIRRAADKPYAALKRSHVADYQELFGRVSLDLGQTDAAIRLAPTDVQLRNYTLLGERNPELEATYFQYGRYLLISSSRTPSVPANLQGLWNESVSPPWRSNYTVNINLEENYWPAETTNLSELHRPLLGFINAMRRTGRQTAEAYYNVHRGWCAGHNSDIWAMTNPVGEGHESPQWANWAMGGAWLSTHLWEHYAFTQDLAFLRENYPVLRGAAEFCLSWLVEKNGELITSFSTSPENSYLLPSGFSGDTFYGGAADLAIIRECVGDAVKAAEALGVDSAFRAEANAKLARLRPYHTGGRGQLLEWYHDWDDKDWTHRHQSHLIGLYPGHHLSPTATPDLAKAAARTLEIKGDKTTGWSTGWRVNLFARLGDADGAYHMVRTLLRYVSPDGYSGKDASRGGGTYPNLFDAHSPFQIDGNFGGCAGIAEMLMQSTEDRIWLLPACPEAWQSGGSVSGLCARGGFIVDFSWENGQVTSVTLSARADGFTTVCANGSEIAVSLKKGETRTLMIQAE